MDIVVSVRRLSDGGLVVADRSHRIRWFDADGALRQSAGGEGGGPGEFRAIPLLEVLAEDSILAIDAGQRRITVFAADGSVARITPMTVADGRGFLLPVELAGNGEILYARSRFRRDASGRYTDTTAFHLAREDGTYTDSAGRHAGREHFADTSEDGPTPHFQLPFTGPSAAAATGDTVWVLVGGGPRLEAWVGGRVVKTDSIPAPRVSMGHDDKAHWLTEQAKRIDPAKRDAWQRRRERMPIPDEKAPFDSLLSGRDGTLWVRRLAFVSDDRERWLRVHGDSELPGEVVLPERFEAYEFGGDYVAGVKADELDIEHVEILQGPP